MFSHGMSTSYPNRLTVSGGQGHMRYLFVPPQSLWIAAPISNVQAMITHWYASGFPKTPPGSSNPLSTIFAWFLDLVSLTFCRGLVSVVQCTSLPGPFWVLHLSGTVGLGSQTRNTICRQSHHKSILPVQFLQFADSHMVVFQASNMEYHRAFKEK